MLVICVGNQSNTLASRIELKNSAMALFHQVHSLSSNRIMKLDSFTVYLLFLLSKFGKVSVTAAQRRIAGERQLLMTASEQRRRAGRARSGAGGAAGGSKAAGGAAGVYRAGVLVTR